MDAKKMSAVEAKLKAPFPYFGGKSSIADDVWQALGDPAHYIEPFFGSGAVLLSRPGFDDRGGEWTETVNDADGFIANVWRGIQLAPDDVAKWCDWPVNHADLMARKSELIRNEERLLEGLTADPKWFDAELAGYWIWAASCWIGSGLTCPTKIPHLGDKGMGVHKTQIPHLGDRGKGVHKTQIPHLGDRGKGVHKTQRPHLGDRGMGVHRAGKRGEIYAWFAALSERLRNVRVVCGDWSRVCGGDWQSNFGTVGVFFDPPYGHAADRQDKLYHADDLDVADKVREWCLERGGRSDHRIVLAGYFDEHAELLGQDWTVKKWSAKGGYANTSATDEDGETKNKTAKGKANRHKEALFFSPHCLDFALFGG